MQKFEFLWQPLLGDWAMSRKKEREKEKKMPFISATYVYASSQGQRTHSPRTNLLLFLYSKSKLVHPKQANYINKQKYTINQLHS